MLLWPLIESELVDVYDASHTYVLRATINGSAENLTWVVQADSYNWFAGDGQTTALVDDAVDSLRAVLASHNQAAPAGRTVSVTLSSMNVITVSITGGVSIQINWSHASTTVQGLPFGWTNVADSASGTSITAPNQTYGAWIPQNPAGTYRLVSTDERPDNRYLAASAKSISGLTRTSYMGGAGTDRDLTWDLLQQRWALAEYADATEPTGTAEHAWLAGKQGKPLRYYTDPTSRTSTSYSLHLLRTEEIPDERSAVIHRSGRWKLRWQARFPLRSTTGGSGTISLPAGGGGASSVRVNSNTVSDPNFNDSTPAAAAGGVNVLWQYSGSNVSAYLLTSSLPLNSDAAVDNRRRPQAGLGRHWYGYIVPDQSARRGFGLVDSGSLSVGTSSFPALATTNLKTATQVERRTSATTANSRIFTLTGGNAGTAVGQVWRGNAANLGGFFCQFRWGFGTVVSTHASFMGLIDGTIGAAWAGSVDPSSQVNLIGVGADTGDTNLYLMHNDGSGTATRIDLGSNFLKTTTTTIWCLELYCDPNTSTISYYIRDESSGNTASGTLSTDIPANTLFLSCIYYMSNRGSGTPGAIAHDMASIYLESLQGV